MTPQTPLRAALVGGPMYDHLYQILPAREVEVAVHADHPTLNREVAALLGRGERIDVLATHSKYAPSQQQWLYDLRGLIDPAAVSGLNPMAVELCRFQGSQLCLPRFVDVRILWYRTDRMLDAPATWDELTAASSAFAFPGRESGLFGTFFELVVAYGGALFDRSGQPTMDTPEAEAAIARLVALARRAPPDLPDWHYDEVDAALLSGRADCAGVWPGGYGPIRASRLARVLRPAPYPAGPVRRVSYAGCHAWAIPRTCGDVDGAVRLVTRLVGQEAGALDAAGGSVPANMAAAAATVPVDEVDAARLKLTATTIATSMITYPPLARFPAVEDAGWQAIRSALRGELAPGEVPPLLQSAALAALAGDQA